MYCLSYCLSLYTVHIYTVCKVDGVLFLQRGILERLDAGEVVIGDGGFVFALEKRGYVKAGPWTPEACIEHPEAGNESSICFRIP